MYLALVTVIGWVKASEDGVVWLGSLPLVGYENFVITLYCALYLFTYVLINYLKQKLREDETGRFLTSEWSA